MTLFFAQNYYQYNRASAHLVCQMKGSLSVNYSKWPEVSPETKALILLRVEDDSVPRIDVTVFVCRQE